MFMAAMGCFCSNFPTHFPLATPTNPVMTAMLDRASYWENIT